MPIVSKITPNGHIILPTSLRKELGFTPGDKILLVREGNTIKIHKAYDQSMSDLYKQ